jgi:hypothetical protein
MLDMAIVMLAFSIGPKGAHSAQSVPSVKIKVLENI